jgi:hypothetical protein
MRNERLVSHIPMAITTIILFLSQIAILAEYITFHQGDNRNAWNTYVRSTINSVAEATAM